MISTLQGVRETVTSTLSAALGDLGGLFDQEGPVYTATLRITDDERLPGGTTLLTPGDRKALVRVAPVSTETVHRTVCIKFPDAYGPGRDQDFLFASSGDGAPMHHAVLATGTAHDRLYSSLWLYLAGIELVTFGARFDGSDSLEFLASGVLSRFRPIGRITLERETHDAHVAFSANNCGNGIRALPPAMLYRG